MPTFAYQARDGTGRRVRGILDADSKIALADRLRKMGYLVTRMEEATLALGGLRRLSLGQAVPPEKFLLAVIQLANLVEAGIPLVSALHSVASERRHGVLARALETVQRDVEAGRPFSEALRGQPEVFPKLLAEMAAVGELSGKLDVVLSRFAASAEKELSLRLAVRDAVSYPIFLLVVCGLVVLMVMGWIVPQFAGFFLRTGVDLPAPTRFLWSTGQLLQTHGWLLGFSAALLWVGAAMGLRRPAVRRRVDRALLRIPVLGEVLLQALTARTARELATLVSSGIPILSALETVKGVADNYAIREELDRVRLAVERGERISATLSVGRVFHPDVVQMVRAGEESGRLDILLDKVADFYDVRVGFAVKQLTALLERVLLGVMGAVVLLIMVSLLLPMFDMVKVIQRGGMR